MLLLAIDIGTSSCKLALFREDGTPAGSVTRGYPLYTPAPGCVEQDADSWWDAVCGGCRELLAQPGIRAEQIAAIGIVVAVLNQVLTRAGRDEQAMMTTLAALVVVLMMVVQEIADLFDLVKTLFHL